MSSTFPSLASDAVVLGLAASAIGIGIGIKSLAPFHTSLGTEDDDDSLLAPKSDEPSSTQSLDATPVKAMLVAVEAKNAVNVTVSEVPLTPPVVEIKGDSIFPASPAA